MSDKRLIKNDYRGYTTFSQVASPRLKAFNRLVTFYQATADTTVKVGQEYIGQFSQEERKEIDTLMGDIKSRGFSQVRREVAEESTDV